MKRYQTAVSHYPEKLNNNYDTFKSFNRIFQGFRRVPWVICVLKVYSCHPCTCVKLRKVAHLSVFENMMMIAYSLTQVWLSFYDFHFVGESVNDMFQNRYLCFS